MAKRELFLVGPKREILGGQNRPILPACVANQNTGFTLSCTLADSEPYIKQIIAGKKVILSLFPDQDNYSGQKIS